MCFNTYTIFTIAEALPPIGQVPLLFFQIIAMTNAPNGIKTADAMIFQLCNFQCDQAVTYDV